MEEVKNNKGKNVSVHVYDLCKNGGGWLGRVILTDDGYFFAFTDWGNFNYYWSTPMEIREFITSLDTQYFANKMHQSVSYQCSTKTMRGCCERFAENILPALKEAIKFELNQ